MAYSKAWDTERWHSLLTADASLVTMVYDAAHELSYDVEWGDGPAVWCLEVFCSDSQWQDLTNITCCHVANTGGMQQ